MVAPNSRLKVNSTMKVKLTKKGEMFNQIRKLATLENARRWDNSLEQFTFCLDLLELCLSVNGDHYCNYWVEILEHAFEVNIFYADLAQDEQVYYDMDFGKV